ncbi:OsmC family peroxiredoxin [Occultella glacieicola]|uniref:OsmC family peroxiredoxin n=1 Tax=Occultella glacieicola TaxID=2518684 RepID=A0ABY2E7F5_9MICO|nr:OsmC family protein [Occultella glacieicola]TDE97490.1 OsmC family peroxiredoxin [Occultella glacieicola]
MEATSPGALWADRTGKRTYTGHNARGAQVLIGPDDAEGVFSPGELLKISLAACNLMSADWPLSRRLGRDFRASVGVETEKVEDENRYGSGRVEIVLDLSELDEQGRADLEEVVRRAVERGCTVGRTLEAGMPHTLSVTDAR